MSAIAKGGLLDRDEVLSAASALAAVPFSSRQVGAIFAKSKETRSNAFRLMFFSIY